MKARSARGGAARPRGAKPEDWLRRLNARLRRTRLRTDAAEPLAHYLTLLAAWNERINLTALEEPDDAIDRLILEPLVASRHLAGATRLMDIGSGGGSPAIPLKILNPGLTLVMVESKIRKGAFLREAIRQLGLTNTIVENRRFEELLAEPGYHEFADVLTIRAVRVQRSILRALQAFVRPGGQILLFRGPGEETFEVEAPLALEGVEPLVETLRSKLVRLRRLELP